MSDTKITESTILKDLKRGGVIHLRREFVGRAIKGLEKSTVAVVAFPKSYEDEHETSVEIVENLRNRGYLKTIVDSPYTEVLALVQ